MGDKRSEIEVQVADRHAAKSSTAIGRKSTCKALPSSKRTRPPQVNDAFKEVTAAQQDAEVLRQPGGTPTRSSSPPKAQGEAAAFDKVYEQYRLAPEVTRRRMYYETMEQVLSKVDKTIVEAPGVTPPISRCPQVQKQQTAAAAAVTGFIRRRPLVSKGSAPSSCWCFCSAASRSCPRPSRPWWSASVNPSGS